MPSSKGQVFSFDPGASGIGQAGNPVGIAMSPAAATTAGSAIAVFASIAGLVGVFPATVYDSNKQSYIARTIQLNATNGCDNGLFTLDNAPSIAAGYSDLVGSGTSTTLTPNGTQTMTLNQFANAPYVNQTSGDTGTVTSNTAGSPGVFTISGMGQVPANGQMFSIGGYICARFNAADDFFCGVAFECVGAATNAYIANSGKSNGGLYLSGDTVTSGTADLGTSPGMAIGICLDDVDNVAPFVPLADTTSGVVDDGSFISFGAALGQPFLRLQHRNFSTAPGLQEMRFRTQSADHFQAHMVAFRDAPLATPQPGIIIPRRRRWGGARMGLNRKEWF